MTLDLKAVEALSELISVPPEGLNNYEIDERLSKLWLAAPELLALAKIGLKAIEWLDAARVSRNWTEPDQVGFQQAKEQLRAARLACEALVSQHQSGGV